METSKLTSKYQATIPQQVRQFLGLGKGDVVRFEIKDDQVILRKLDRTYRYSAEDLAFMKLQEEALTEWQSDQDDDLLPPWRPDKPG